MCFSCVTAGPEFRTVSTINDKMSTAAPGRLRPSGLHLNGLCRVPEPHSPAADNEKVASAAQNARRDVSYSGDADVPAFGSWGIEVRSFLRV